MPSVVTGQAPITLERKITSGGKTKTEDNTRNDWNKSYTSMYIYTPHACPLSPTHMLREGVKVLRGWEDG